MKIGEKQVIKIDISKSYIKFLEKANKMMKKKTYDKEQNLVADEYDIKEKQAPLKVFNEVNSEKNKEYKYKPMSHRRKVYSFFGLGEPLPFHLLLKKVSDEDYTPNKAEELDLEINEINYYEENKAIA